MRNAQILLETFSPRTAPVTLSTASTPVHSVHSVHSRATIHPACVDHKTVHCRLHSIAHGEKVILPSERKEVSVQPDTLAKYVGTYELSPKSSIVITLEGNQLTAQATARPKLSLFAESETKPFTVPENPDTSHQKPAF